MKSHCLARQMSLGLLALVVSAAGVFAQAPDGRDIFVPGYDFATPRTPTWPRFFRLGALVGLNLNADFGISGNFDISRSRPGEADVGGVDHFYDDGFVRVDQTGNAPVDGKGLTSFWGYDNASQVSGNKLTMHSAKSFAAASGATSQGDAASLGVDLAYGGLLRRFHTTYIGWEFGFGYLPVSIDAAHTLNGMVTRTVHWFDTGGIVMPTPPFSGGDSGIGPTIHDIATALDDEQVAATLDGKQTLDADLFLFRLGPTFYWNLNRKLALAVSAGGAVGLVSGDLKFNDTLLVDDGSTSHNSGSVGDSDLTFGGFVNGTLTYHVEEHGDLYLSLQYLPMGSVTFEGGGRRAELDMMGSVFISVGVNWPF